MLEEKLIAGILLKDTNDGVKQDNLVKKIAHYVKDYNLDIFLGPEWLFVPKERLYSSLEKDELVKNLTGTTRDSDALVIPGSIIWYDNKHCYNATPIISKGELLGTYHKRADGGTTQIAEDRYCKKKLSKGKEFGVYNWRGYSLGVEICADQGDLYDWIKKKKLPLLDFYFLLSCGALLDRTDIPVKEGGYGLYSDGFDKESQVVKRSISAYQFSFEEIKRKCKKEGCLDIYELVLTNKD